MACVAAGGWGKLVSRCAVEQSASTFPGGHPPTPRMGQGLHEYTPRVASSLQNNRGASAGQIHRGASGRSEGGSPGRKMEAPLQNAGVPALAGAVAGTAEVITAATATAASTKRATAAAASYAAVAASNLATATATTVARLAATAIKADAATEAPAAQWTLIAAKMETAAQAGVDAQAVVSPFPPAKRKRQCQQYDNLPVNQLGCLEVGMAVQ